jgi:hypothetical protein
VKKSNYRFMKEHASQFDEKLSKIARNESCGLPKEAGMKKGKIADGRQGHLDVSSEIKQEIQSKWEQIVEPVTGCASYEELRQQLKALQPVH